MRRPQVNHLRLPDRVFGLRALLQGHRLEGMYLQGIIPLPIVPQVRVREGILQELGGQVRIGDEGRRIAIALMGASTFQGAGQMLTNLTRLLSCRDLIVLDVLLPLDGAGDCVDVDMSTPS